MNDSSASHTTTVLIILDGFGHRVETADNAIAHASTPTWDRLWRERPHTLVSTSGLDVGLPEGQMGNSEVGHMSLGSGRIIYQSMTRIDQAIADGTFATNPVFLKAVDDAVRAGRAVHIMGLLSPGGVHSSETHLWAAIRLAAARGADRIYLHAFLDGRDTPPRSAAPSIAATQAVFDALGVGRFASLHGRYWAMDRDQRWDRIAKSYALLTEGVSAFAAQDASQALSDAYSRDETDEFVEPTRIGEPIPIDDGDAVLFMNFRADRARQLSQALVLEQFSGFPRQCWPRCQLVTATCYDEQLPCPVAFAKDIITNSLGEIVANAGRTQLRIAETEKYAHVTFFFSGGQEAAFAGETRQLIPSPNVVTYDLDPAMSAPAVTEALVKAIENDSYDFIVVNFANGDMVGHTGVFGAAVKAVEALDVCLQQVISALEVSGGQALITADHGNCEQMIDYETGQPHTQHTTGQVPLVYVGADTVKLRADHVVLADVAPTLLHMMGLAQPSAMSGRNLIENC